MKVPNQSQGVRPSQSPGTVRRRRFLTLQDRLLPVSVQDEAFGMRRRAQVIGEEHCDLQDAFSVCAGQNELCIDVWTCCTLDINNQFKDCIQDYSITSCGVCRLDQHWVPATRAFR